jgi:replicative DNA helicase
MNAVVADLDLEAVVLAAAMLDCSALDGARRVFGGRDDVFFSDANQRIWDAMAGLDDDGVPVDLPAIMQRLREEGRLDQIGGSTYLAQLVEMTPAVASIDHHARKLSELATSRRLVDACRTAVIEGTKGGGDSGKWARNKADEFQDLVGATAESVQEHDIRDLMRVVVDEMSARRRGEPIHNATPTAWIRLDAKLGGWLDGNMYVLAARPGMGKTSLALQAVLDVAERGKIGLFMGLEMPDRQVGQRALSIKSAVPVNRINSGVMHDAEYNRVLSAAQAIARLPVFIGDNGGQTMAQLRGAIRRQVRRLRSVHGEGTKIGIIAVDYLQLIKANFKAGRSRENEVSEISAGLKQLAKEFQCPVLALSQLSRECEKRPNKRPILSDLRESGSIEQDAYGILFLYRDDYYVENSPDPGVCEVNLAKHRNGPCGMIKLDFNAELTRFDEPPDHFDMSPMEFN